MISDMMIREYTKIANPSAYQMGMFKHMIMNTTAIAECRPAESLIIRAAPGSGKTTSAVAANALIVNAFNQCGYGMGDASKPLPPMMFLAFNKTIAGELGERLPKDANKVPLVPAKTLNAYGHGVLTQYLRKAYNIFRVNVDSSKNFMIRKNLGMSYEDSQKYGGDVDTLVARCKALGVIPEGLGESYEPLNGQFATDETLRSICEHFGEAIEPTLEQAIFNWTRRVLTAGLRDLTMIDFDDQKYIPVVLCPAGPGSRIITTKYAVIGVDEAQDVNPVDLELIRISLAPGGMVLAVGDRNQSIYGFRGADVNSLDNIQKAFAAKELPLSITYRCGQAIVDVLNEIYPGSVEAAPNAKPGKVETHQKFNASLFQPTDMIISRVNAPLVSMAYRLIRSRVRVHMMGRDFGRNLLSLIEKIAGKKRNGRVDFGKNTVRDLAELLDQWQDNQIALINKKNPNNETAKTAISDRADTIRVFIEENVDNRIETVTREISNLFGTFQKGSEEELNKTIPKDAVVLSSAHRSKGLESDRAFLLQPEMFMNGRAKAGSWQEVQERNCLFVASSRPKNHLGYIRLENMAD